MNHDNKLSEGRFFTAAGPQRSLPEQHWAPLL